jgi:tRNA-binding EMAP/Myf-like protein
MGVAFARPAQEWKKRRGRIVTIEYDPNQNAYICRIHYGDGEKRYNLHPRRAIIGDTIVYGTKVPIKMVNALPLSVVWTIDEKEVRLKPKKKKKQLWIETYYLACFHECHILI